jgi:hypothetical protein
MARAMIKPQTARLIATTTKEPLVKVGSTCAPMRRSAGNNPMAHVHSALPLMSWMTTWRTRIESLRCTVNFIGTTSRPGHSKWCCAPGRQSW